VFAGCVVASDPLIWEQHPDKTRHTAEGFKKFFQGALDSGGALVAIDAKTRQVIGSSRYHDYSKEKDVVETGWTFLGRKYWGGRYNGEVKRLMLTHEVTRGQSAHPALHIPTSNHYFTIKSSTFALISTPTILKEQIFNPPTTVARSSR
jgi:hypothetical protein